MTFWDREISIWRVFRGPTSAYENADGQRHRLVGKVLIQVRKVVPRLHIVSDMILQQGEENITSAMLSADAKLLVVATISGVKVFSVRRRKGDERGALRIHKLDVPSALSDDGARLVTISPDTRWLCVVRPNSDIYLARITLGPAHGKPEILPQMIGLKRAERHARYEKVSHGTLGEYERTIRCVAFSEDSKVLASGDLSGCVDTWVLENAAGSTSTAAKASKATGSDDESSDDEDEELPVLEGQRWHAAATESPIPRLKSGVVLMSFRPKAQAEPKRLTNGTNHATQDPPTESRLMVLTSEHQLVEFDALEGKLSDWSRRNPKAYLPAEFRGVKDRAMGCLWDLSESRERLWLYGTSWLWMFDLNQDFPSPEEISTSSKEQDDQDQQRRGHSAAHKRKRESLEDGENAARKKKPNSGAGDRMTEPESAMFIGASSGSIRKIVGPDASNAEWISVAERPRSGAENTQAEDDDNDDEDTAAANDATLAQLRRQNTTTDNIDNDNNNSTPQKSKPLTKQAKSLLAGAASALTDTPTTSKILRGQDGDVDTPQKAVAPSAAGGGGGNHPPRRWWHTYKYRDILGIVPLSPSGEPDDDDEYAGGKPGGPGGSPHFEVAVIERPMWDVELPGRYLRDYE